MAPKAIITDIHPLSTHDGPGLRTTIFFKGCSLNCLWCHNPETINRDPEMEWDAKKCLDCRTCEAVCPENAINFKEHKGYLINKSKCNNCGLCATACPSRALKIVGMDYSVNELLTLILKDEKFIKRSKGGVTFSGGEPALHYPFISDLARKLKGQNFHLALDTCGMAPGKAYEELLPDMDLILFDIKEMDSLKHKAFTGIGNELIMNNLLSIRETIKKKNLKTKLWIRTPIIPGMTNTSENISAIGEFLSRE
ncbi:MAG: glycyl-radical enzyme activating protein, partial [Marinilabiliaceae bacterium]|nr:glycyl-radical enzyme activating protein [Marinilabiliaceae bacterium]